MPFIVEKKDIFRKENDYLKIFRTLIHLIYMLQCQSARLKNKTNLKERSLIYKEAE